jgi:hypothetical protein
MKQSTEQLTNEIIMTPDMEEWQERRNDAIVEMSLSEYLQQMLFQYHATKKEIILRSDLDTTYGYQIFQGRKNPSRDVLLKIAFGFSLSLEDTKHLLYYGNASTLYPRVKRDAYIMYALHRGFSLLQTNQYLFEHGENTLDG